MAPPKHKKTALEKELEELQARAKALDIETRIKQMKEDIAAKETILGKKIKDVPDDISENDDLNTTLKSGNSFILFEFLFLHMNSFFMMIETTECYVCRKYISKKNLARHINSIHKKEKRFQCKICRQRFTTKVNKMNHESKCEC